MVDSGRGGVNNAGTFGICVLFGIFPALMAGITRSRNANNTTKKNTDDYIELVPGMSITSSPKVLLL